MKIVIAFVRDERAATSIEYALLASGIALAIIGAVNGLVLKLGTSYDNVKTALQ